MNGFRDCQVKKLELSPCGCQRAGEKDEYKSYRTYKTYIQPSSDPQSPGPDQTGSPSGDQSAVEPPGPIPNPEVKRRSADGSETIGLVRVGRRQVYARLQAVKCSEPGSFFAHE